VDTFVDILRGGVDGFVDYLSAHVITCLVPALFIGGAIAVFISQASVLRYFGPKANKVLSYGVASVSGTILAVCSCTVLPLFGGIYRRGAGLGPAIAFLFSGPAINILAITYSARLLGYDIGLARAIGAIGFSIVIGLIMAFIFRKEETEKDEQAFAMLAADPDDKKPWQHLVFFGTLVGILLSAASKKWIILGVLMVLLLVVLWRWFKKGEILLWMKETLHLIRLILPWLLVGVFIAGMLRVAIPEWVITDYVGGNTLQGNFIASLFGAFMYFATLTEVPIVKSFMELGMGKGPALALLLAGPALSLPSMLVLRSIMGGKKTLVYLTIVVLLATICGYLFGLIVE